jgi:general nucleoside transport system permease protein
MDLSSIILLASFTIQFTVTIGIAAQGELLTEKSGILNIGIQGVLTFSAFTAGVANFVFAQSLGWASPVAGLLLGILAGMAVNFFFAFLSTQLNVDQVIAGIGINILAGGITQVILLEKFTYNGTPQANYLPSLLTINGVAGVSIIVSPLEVLMFILPVVVYFVLNRTRLGLHARAVGENPKAAEVAGVSVMRTRLIATTLGGILLGIAGAYTSIDRFNFYDKNVYLNGYGFIAIAAVIAGGWKPSYVLGVSLLFGLSLGLNSLIGDISGAPFYLLTMLPYLATVAVLAIASKRLRPPAALAAAYKKE